MRHLQVIRAALVVAGMVLPTALASTALAGDLDPDSDSLARTTPEQLRNGDDSQLRFLAYFITRGEVTNVAPTNDLLQGRVVGRLFGPNTTSTSQGTSWLVEQRLIPFVVFEPKILDKMARLRASFELNWTWGDTSYSTGGNFGGALSGRSVNLETQNVEIEIDLPHRWHLNLGLQRLWDNIRDPYRTFFSTMALTGERLAFWGTDAVGISAHGAAFGQLFRFGAYDLYHNKVQIDDHVLLFEALTDRDIRDGWHVGGSVRYLRDTSSGAGGVSVLGQGPDSTLADYNGVFRFPLNGQKYHANLAWVGIDTSYNPEFTAGRFGGSAFAVASLGRVDVLQQDGSYAKVADVLGLALDARVGFRYGNTRNDIITGEVIYTTGDANGISDGRYSGVITGNTYGAPAGVFTTSGAYLLMPHANVVNRYYSAVPDISNQGYGLTAGTLNAYYDLYRNVLTAKLGAAVGSSNVAPPGGGHFIGVEGNAMLVYRIRVFLSVELHAAYLHLGDFYDSPREQAASITTNPVAAAAAGTGRPADPWTAFLAVKWLMF
ncbi:MAG TPA: hypothetical protein VHB97_11420 [Polyangia bacterium]|jgi:hypothetical protein|nr:hypothetical protein [Polyangia bacterium]